MWALKGLSGEMGAASQQRLSTQSLPITKSDWNKNLLSSHYGCGDLEPRSLPAVESRGQGGWSQVFLLLGNKRELVVGGGGVYWLCKMADK